MLLDIPSIASMTRNLVEAYDVFWYLTVDKISEDESEFRFALSSHHHNVEFLKITENLKLKIDDPTGIWEIARPHSKRWLEGTAFFKSLHPKQQAELLKGKRPFFLGNRTPAKWKYINQDAMRGLYKFMSNNAHTHPVSITLMIPLKVRRNIENEDLLPLVVECAVQHLALALNDYLNKRRRYSQMVSSDDKKFIKQMFGGI